MGNYSNEEKKVETKSKYCNSNKKIEGLILPLSSIRPKFSSLSAEIAISSV